MLGLLDAAEMRALYEEAVTAVGTHVTQGGLIWAHWRRFELAAASAHDRIERTRAVWLRQAMVPCPEEVSKQLVEEYRAWEAEVAGDAAEGLLRFKEAAEVSNPSFALIVIVAA